MSAVSQMSHSNLLSTLNLEVTVQMNGSPILLTHTHTLQLPQNDKQKHVHRQKHTYNATPLQQPTAYTSVLFHTHRHTLLCRVDKEWNSPLKRYREVLPSATSHRCFHSHKPLSLYLSLSI